METSKDWGIQTDRDALYPTRRLCRLADFPEAIPLKSAGGFLFDPDFPDGAIGVIADVYSHHRDSLRLRFTHRYASGEEWIEYGYIGRTGGAVPTPLVIHSRRSYGGGVLSGSHLVQISTSAKRNRRILWEKS